MNKEYYVEQLDQIMIECKIEATWVHTTFKRGIENEDLTACIIDTRTPNARKAKKLLGELVNNYLTDYPQAKRPLYSL